MLELKELGKTFGGVKAVQDVSMSLLKGEVRGLIGPNGAGKSTLVNLISGLLRQSSGTMILNGVSLDHLSAHKRAQMGIGRTFQNLRVFASLTVQQNIDVALNIAKSGGQGHAEFVQSAIEKFDLVERLHMRAGSLAYGYLRRLEIVRAL
ncbi:MAG: ATP-binding cassette domain-containing protein, partial [Rhodobacteraceae bacterium]|nr:ATP-binding cassette domain-containing protein [Paracoccaceae bacterium]NDH26683.1 ATP-binding cassette domain-containing protein [Paracoccaceae bacterium]